MEIHGYSLIILMLGIVFFASVVLALRWAFKNGQFSNLEKDARSIFSEDEPEGEQTDFFPNKSKGQVDK